MSTTVIVAGMICSTLVIIAAIVFGLGYKLAKNDAKNDKKEGDQNVE